VGGGVQLSPLGTAATTRPIVPAPGDYDGEIGGMIGRGNWSTRRKPAPVQLCPPQTTHAARTRTRTTAVGSQRNLYVTFRSAFKSRSGDGTHVPLQYLSALLQHFVRKTWSTHTHMHEEGASKLISIWSRSICYANWNRSNALLLYSRGSPLQFQLG
jgi:hypothetical protein